MYTHITISQPPSVAISVTVVILRIAVGVKSLIT
jgi:hypothetical protein